MNATQSTSGFDVDDTQYHGSAFRGDSGELVDFQCRPRFPHRVVACTGSFVHE
jgi:hypothetical protein